MSKVEEVEFLIRRVQAILGDERDRMEEARQEASRELQEARAQLERERAEVARARRLETKLQGVLRGGEVVRLNVGGTIYCTSVETLRKEESFLSAMFSGRFEVARDEATQSYFIDRDGPAFRHVLNYLRRGRLVIAEDAALQAEVLEEARFYQLRSLVRLLEPSKVVFDAAQDSRGLFHWLGTAARTRDFLNPVSSGQLKVRASRDMHGAPESLAALSPARGGICTDARNHYVEIDLGKDRLMLLSAYRLGADTSCCRPANWQLQGSSDHELWTVLRAHVDDRSLTGDSHTWDIPSKKGDRPPYVRWLRLVGTGRDQDSATCYCLHFCCMEVFGELRVSKRKDRKKKRR